MSDSSAAVIASAYISLWRCSDALFYHVCLLFTLLTHHHYIYDRFYSTVPAAAKATCSAIAAQCLVDKLNAEAGSTVYAYIKPASAPPTDVIANGIIYRIGVVTPVGAPQLLTYTPAAKSRDSLIQVYFYYISQQLQQYAITTAVAALTAAPVAAMLLLVLYCSTILKQHIHITRSTACVHHM
eukprot:10079-Heterococcus_DN1.PRE.2